MTHHGHVALLPHTTVQLCDDWGLVTKAPCGRSSVGDAETVAAAAAAAAETSASSIWSITRLPPRLPRDLLMDRREENEDRCAMSA